MGRNTDDDGAEVVSFIRYTYHTARKPHGAHIKPGDRYQRMVIGGYYKNGARWLSVTKTRALGSM